MNTDIQNSSQENLKLGNNTLDSTKLVHKSGKSNSELMAEFFAINKETEQKSFLKSL